jgi:hypothetical protein
VGGIIGLQAAGAALYASSPLLARAPLRCGAPPKGSSSVSARRCEGRRAGGAGWQQPAALLLACVQGACRLRGQHSGVAAGAAVSPGAAARRPSADAHGPRHGITRACTPRRPRPRRRCAVMQACAPGDDSRVPLSRRTWAATVEVRPLRRSAGRPREGERASGGALLLRGDRQAPNRGAAARLPARTAPHCRSARVCEAAGTSAAQRAAPCSPRGRRARRSSPSLSLRCGCAKIDVGQRGAAAACCCMLWCALARFRSGVSAPRPLRCASASSGCRLHLHPDP